DAFWEQVLLYARQFCPPHKASKAVGLIKRAVQSGAEVPFESALAIERELQQQLFQSEDAKEGIAAYNEKRVAEFKGKRRPTSSLITSGGRAPRGKASPTKTPPRKKPKPTSRPLTPRTPIMPSGPPRRASTPLN